MIPKVIHYCWFGKNPKPMMVRQCISSWRKYLPNFEVRNRKIKTVFKYFQLAFFYRVYTSLFSKELIENAVYTTQWVDLKEENISTKLSAENKSLEDELLLSMADKLVRRYAKAKMVITSRIHCGLPSLGCETPVLFVTSEELQSQSKTKVGGRLEGLSDLFHLVTYKKIIHLL